MNQLGVNVTDLNERSFELLVDGVPLSKHLNDGYDGIPYWIVEDDDLPHWPPHGGPGQEGIRIVTVCECGEYGCGHARCQVTKGDDEVVFDRFQRTFETAACTARFVFARKNYEEVIAAIVADAAQKRRIGQSRA